MQIPISSLTHPETKSFAAPILAMLQPLNPEDHLTEIAVKAREFVSAMERDAYLREPFEGGDGSPSALKGVPRFAAFFALTLLNDAKAMAARINHPHTTPDSFRTGLLDVVLAFFVKSTELEERLHSSCFGGATHSGRWLDDGGPDSPRELIRAMMGDLVTEDSIFTRTNGGDIGVNWQPLNAALQHQFLRMAVNL